MKKLFFIAFIMLITLSCSKSDDNSQPLNVTTEELNLFVNEYLTISASSSEKISYTSENPLIAKVDDNGKVTAVLVGETNIKVTDGKTTKSVKVTVSPKNTLFFEPILVSSKEEFIEKYRKSGGEFSERTSSVAYLFNKNTEKAYAYMFLDSTSAVVLYIPITSYHSIARITDWVKERYIGVTKEGDIYYFGSPDEKIILGLQYSASDNVVLIVFNKGSK